MSIFQANAQRKASRILKLANIEANKQRYAYAIPLYKTYIVKGGKDSIVYKKLGEAYKMVNQFDSAVKYYQIAGQTKYGVENVLAELYAMTGNYSLAKNEYERIVEQNKTLLSDARLYGFSNTSKYYSDSLDYKIYPTKLNTIYNEFNAVPFKDGLIFESNRIASTNVKKKHTNKIKQILSPEFAWDGASYSKLYYIPSIKELRTDTLPNVNWKDKQVGYAEKMRESSNDNRKMISSYGYIPTMYKVDTTVQLFSKQFDDRYNVGAITFTADGTTAYYTRNGKKARNGYMLEIWESNFENGAWTPGKRLFFNNPNYNYFHPAVTPDGRRLYYVTDEPTGLGGTDIYYVDKNEDGSWKATTNAGQDINTTGNELFPSFYDGTLFFSSNGHPGLGGLDIFRIYKDARGELSIKNMGYPINSDKDDLGLSIIGKTGFFSSNRNGSDDIFAFDHEQVYINMTGNVNIDSAQAIGKTIYLTQKDELGRVQIIDSAILDQHSAYTFKMRPNRNYSILTFDGNNKPYEQAINSNDYKNNNGQYIKQASTIYIPLTEKELAAKQEKEAALLAKERASMGRVFAKTVDSLMKLTKDFAVLHHPYNQAFIVQKDLTTYYQLIERVKRIHGKKIVIVSASDCNGPDEYNETLSQRRGKRVFKTLNAISNNMVILKTVGEKELLKDCNDIFNAKEDQLENRYSYVFILDQK
ncbi:MAG: hypothetical protein RLZ56_611 [Bacteroidota bacterium]|jgi:outer membrane protein OmpA-like peptidoglycan-associated protein